MKCELKTRGWTECAIARFLGNPDREELNPRYRKAAPMKLYSKSRVEEIETGNPYKEFVIKNNNRRNASKDAADTKKQRLLEQVDGWQISTGKIPYHKVVENAICSYNDFHDYLECEHGHSYELASLDSDRAFLERISVNYLRHNLSSYDTMLDELFGKVGKSEAYRVLNKKIYDKIAETYPELRSECERQMTMKDGDF